MANKAVKPRLTAEQMRELVATKRQRAEVDIAAARRELATKQEERKKPPPKYVEMPESTGNAELDAAADLEAVESGFNKRRKDEEARFARAVDGEYWGAICFRTREQRDAFFTAIGADDFRFGPRNYDGNLIAAKMGIKLPEAGERLKPKPPDSSWAKFADDSKVAHYAGAAKPQRRARGK